MEVHAGDRNAGTAPKTEVLFVAAPGTLYEDPATWDNTDLSDIELGDGRFIPVTAEFKYLGSMLNRNCRDGLDVDVRLKAASAAFGALKRCVFSVKAITARAKRAVYVGLILAILLHGAESWCLTEGVYNRLRRFHAQSACHVSSHAETLLGTQDIDLRSTLPFGSRTDRHLHFSTTTPLGRSRRSHAHVPSSSEDALLLVLL